MAVNIFPSEEHLGSAVVFGPRDADDPIPEAMRQGADWAEKEGVLVYAITIEHQTKNGRLEPYLRLIYRRR